MSDIGYIVLMEAISGMMDIAEQVYRLFITIMIDTIMADLSPNQSEVALVAVCVGARPNDHSLWNDLFKPHRIIH